MKEHIILHEFKSDTGASVWIRLDMICGVREMWSGDSGDGEFIIRGSTVSAGGNTFIISMLPKDLVALVEDRLADAERRS